MEVCVQDTDAEVQTPCRVLELGLVPYAEAYNLQKKWVGTLKADPSHPDILLMLEHPEVYTYGRRTPESEIKLLGDLGVSIERGGEATYHNPGQLVVYPILHLGPDERDLHLHLRRLETTLIAVLDEWGILAERRDGATGVWTIATQKKIASIGVAVSGWVTYHGVALNVSNDLKGFGRIHPCGFEASVMTSMRDELEGNAPCPLEIRRAFERHFARIFGREC